MRVFEAYVARPVARLRFTPDGRRLTASFPRYSRLATWDVATGAVEAVASLPVRAVTCFDYSPDGTMLAVGSADGIARVYRLPELACLTELPVGGPGEPFEDAPVRGAVFASTADQEKRWLAVVGYDCLLWNPVTGATATLPEPDQYTAAAFAPDSAAVYVGWRNVVSECDVMPFRERYQFTVRGRVRALDVGSDGRLLAVADDWGFAVIRTDGGGRVNRDGPPTDLAFTPDGRLLAVTLGDSVVRLYDTATGAPAREYDFGVGRVTAVAFAPDGTLGAAGGDRGRVAVWDLDT